MRNVAEIHIHPGLNRISKKLKISYLDMYTKLLTYISEYDKQADFVDQILNGIDAVYNFIPSIEKNKNLTQ